MSLERLSGNQILLDGLLVDPGLLPMDGLSRFGTVTAVLKDDLTDWADYPSDGFITALRVNPCDADGRRVDHSTELLIHGTRHDAPLGYAAIAIEDVICFVDVDRTWREGGG